MKVAFEIQNRQQVFTHKDDDGAMRTFLVGTMNEFASKYGHVCEDVIGAMVPITSNVIFHIKERMGIEQARLDRLCSPHLEQPLIGILWPPDNKVMTIVDGNHRAIRLWEKGEQTMKIWCFKYPFWEQFLLKREVSEEVLTGYSGIIEHELQSNNQPHGVIL